MSPVCAFCGQLYDDGRPNCPHCGADVDLTYSDDSYSPDFELYDESMGDEEYERYLEREGLAEPRPKPRPPPSWSKLTLLLLFLGLLLGLTFALFWALHE